MKKIPMLTSFDLPRLRFHVRKSRCSAQVREYKSARVAQLSTTQLVERSDALSAVVVSKPTAMVNLLLEFTLLMI
ncbi:hypothetical protein [Nostoc sp. CHAB 5715]|uniref:hypothetical protein n=1 Tax=Nostoc sp. CHAB 5715 TaxID=2780400 RepID=UPI001E43C99D|nr:hypothetical protein [Nostoc sp. CHAB 5715]